MFAVYAEFQATALRLRQTQKQQLIRWPTGLYQLRDLI